MVYHFCSFPLSYFHNVASTGLLVPKRILGLTWFNHDFTKRLPLVGWFFPSLLLNPPPTWQASSASSHCWPFTANCTEMWTVQKTLSFTQRDDSWNVLWKGDVMDMNHQNQWFIIYGMLIIKIIGFTPGNLWHAIGNMSWKIYRKARLFTWNMDFLKLIFSLQQIPWVEVLGSASGLESLLMNGPNTS